MEEPTVLLTNDDGIDSPGIEALYHRLREVAEVMVVAPSSDRSAIGRALSGSVDVHDHQWGYSVDGTPSDCVVAGLETLVPDTDIVVSGCNKGANVGSYVLGRSGTVSAAVEAAFFDVPAIATSLYVKQGDADFRSLDLPAEEYAVAADATAYLVTHSPAAGVFDTAEYLNLNAPRPRDFTGGMTVTHPSSAHDMTAHRDGHTVHLEDRLWHQMAHGEVPDGDGDTDRRALANGAVSVSPLTAPHTTEFHDALDQVATEYDDVAAAPEDLD